MIDNFVFDQRGKVIIFNGLIWRLADDKIKLVRFLSLNIIHMRSIKYPLISDVKNKA